ncbi:MAG: hypothetical protein AAF725_19660 [Acidobacteriota bacterium]
MRFPLPLRPPAPGPFLLAAALLAALATPGALQAHSFDRSFASARYVAQLENDELWMAVVVEVPTLDVLGDFRRYLRDHPEKSEEANVEGFRLQQLREIADAFELRFDGGSLERPWRPVDGEANGKGDGNFFLYMVEFRSTLVRPRLQVELINRLMPEKVVYMSTLAEATAPWRVREDSSRALLEAEGIDGEIVGPDIAADADADAPENEAAAAQEAGERESAESQPAGAVGKWSTDESLRRLRLVFSTVAPGEEAE